MLADDGIGARRIDDVDVVELHRRHLRRRRRDPFFHPALAGEGVDERALSRVELTDDDEKEQFVEPFDRSFERRHVVVARAEADQARAQIVEDAALFADDIQLSWIENVAQRHRGVTCANRDPRQ